MQKTGYDNGTALLCIPDTIKSVLYIIPDHHNVGVSNSILMIDNSYVTTL